MEDATNPSSQSAVARRASARSVGPSAVVIGAGALGLLWGLDLSLTIAIRLESALGGLFFTGSRPLTGIPQLLQIGAFLLIIALPALPGLMVTRSPNGVVAGLLGLLLGVGGSLLLIWVAWQVMSANHLSTGLVTSGFERGLLSVFYGVSPTAVVACISLFK